MAFSFFTKSAREISTRLGLIARAFQFSAIFVSTFALATTYGLRLMSFESVRMYPWMFPPQSVAYELLRASSMFIIGRALLRRQRWGAYLAAVTLGVPFVKQLLNPDAAILSIPEIAVATLALGAIVTVWDELGTVRDNEFANPEDENANELPSRNRGFGEPRSLPLNDMHDVIPSGARAGVNPEKVASKPATVPTTK